MAKRKGPSVGTSASLSQLRDFAQQNLSHQDPTRWEHVRSLTPTGGGTRNEPRCPGAPARMCLLRALAAAREMTAYAPLHHSHDTRIYRPRREQRQSRSRGSRHCSSAKSLCSERGEGTLCNCWQHGEHIVQLLETRRNMKHRKPAS